jgi:hypothetical protein
MAAASLLTFSYPYSVYPHLDGLNIGPHRKTTRSCAAPEPLFHTWRGRDQRPGLRTRWEAPDTERSIRGTLE